MIAQSDTLKALGAILAVLAAPYVTYLVGKRKSLADQEIAQKSGDNAVVLKGMDLQSKFSDQLQTDIERLRRDVKEGDEKFEKLEKAFLELRDKFDELNRTSKDQLAAKDIQIAQLSDKLRSMGQEYQAEIVALQHNEVGLLGKVELLNNSCKTLELRSKSCADENVAMQEQIDSMQALHENMLKQISVNSGKPPSSPPGRAPFPEEM